jgi:hypothetical protein
MRQLFPRLAPVLALALLTASCATSRITNTWKKPDAPAAAYGKILVVSITTEENVRRSVEDAFVARLQALGVTGIPSYTIAKETQVLSKDEKIALVKKSGADAALVTRLVKVEKRTQFTAGYYDSGGSFYNSWDGAWSGAYIPPTTYSYDIVFLENKLFDVKSEELVWAVATETTDPGQLDKEIAGYAKLVVNALKKDALLATASK